MKKTIAALLFVTTVSPLISAAEYVIDVKGAHAFINFKIKHLNYSWLTGRFNDFDGQFSYDANNPENASVSVTIDTASIDSNHAERDKHLRGDDFLDVGKFPQAKFVSTKIIDKGNGNLSVAGDLTLHGVTKAITIDAEKIGEGQDPWGGYRAGFSGTTTLKLADYGIDYDLGPASTHVEMLLHIEGIRQ
ncbi:MAG: YceI family protein [Aestuariibacter sp.]